MSSPDPVLYETRVRRGARFMDEKHPNWYRKISLDQLVMQDPTSCIIGQTFPKRMYGHSVTELVVGDALAVYDKALGRRVQAFETKHGFNLEASLQMKDDCQEHWDMLRKLWEVQIQERLIADLA